MSREVVPRHGYMTEPYYGTFLDSESQRGAQLRSYEENAVGMTAAPGQYFAPEATVWHEVSSGLCFERGHSPTITWVDFSEATTWQGPLEVDDTDTLLGQGVQVQVRSAIRAAQGEHFESGYESQLRKTLGRMYRVLGLPVVEAVCSELGRSGINDEILAQIFKFLVDVRNSVSSDLRLVSIAQFLLSKSALARDAAATALSALDDRRAAAYLREAAVRESHPMLKHEFLEIVAELEER